MSVTSLVQTRTMLSFEATDEKTNNNNVKKAHADTLTRTHIDDIGDPILNQE